MSKNTDTEHRTDQQSAKPYVIRAICEWCKDQGLTPYIKVKVNSQTKVPPAFVKDGEIVLNISHAATRRLTIENEWVQFTTRFNGSLQGVAVPVPAIVGVFAKESGYGFAFQPSAMKGSANNVFDISGAPRKLH